MGRKISRSEKKAKRQEKMARKTAEPKPKVTKTVKEDSKLVAYLKGVQQEMHRVTWPTRAETLSTSRFVVSTLIVGGFALWAVDTLTVMGVTGLAGLHI